MEENIRVKNSIEDARRIGEENYLYWAKVFWKDCFDFINEVSCFSEQPEVINDFINEKEKFYSNSDVAKELYIVGNICSPIYKKNKKENFTIPGFEFMSDFDEILVARRKGDE